MPVTLPHVDNRPQRCKVGWTKRGGAVIAPDVSLGANRRPWLASRKRTQVCDSRVQSLDVRALIAIGRPKTNIGHATRPL